MSTPMKTISLIFVSIFFLFSFQGCDPSKKDIILIGVAGPMTGDQSKQGQDMKNGVALAVQEWNEKGGVLGKKIEILTGDDQHDPKQAVSVANRFVNSGVAGVVGHWNSSSTIPASEVYHEAGIPMVTPASTNPQVTDRGYINIFRVCGRDDQQGRVAAEFVLKELKLRRIGVLHDKTTYGQGLADQFVLALGDRVEIVYYAGIIQGDKDFRGVLTTLASKNPEIYFFGGYYPEAGLLVKQAQEVGLDVPMMSGDGTIDPVFIKIAGPAAEGTYLTYTRDMMRLPGAQALLKRYNSRFGQPGPYSFYAYDAAQVLIRGIQTAGTTDGFGISQAIHTSAFDGVSGRLQFDEKGDRLTSQYVVWVTQNGTFEEIWKPKRL